MGSGELIPVRETIMWLIRDRLFILNDDLCEYIEEMGYNWPKRTATRAEFVELWELVLDWQKEVQK